MTHEMDGGERPVVADLLDHPEAIDIVARWINTQWSSISGRTLAQTRERFSEGIERNRLPVTHVAFTDDRLVGVASLRVRDSFDFLPGATPWICNVFVDERARGRRVAGTLCASLEEQARALRYEEVFLATAKLEDSLYHRLGFEDVARVEAHGEMAAVLRKALA